MSLLRDIQNAATSSQAPVSDLLRQCKILAARLGSPEFGSWIEQELNGYPDKDHLPKYRTLRNLESVGHFAGAGGRMIKNAPIPSTCLPDQWQEWARTEYLLDAVGVYEQLLRKESEGQFQSPWPANLVRLYGAEIYQYMNCVQAWKVIPRGTIVGLIDAIRNRVLGFALEIEKENPAAGDVAMNTQPIPAQTLSQVFNTQIYGNVGNVASGSTNVSQSAEINVAAGDLDQLQETLRHLGVTEADVAALRIALDEDQVDKPLGGLGQRSAQWIGNMLGKAASGAWNVSLTTASTVLPKLLSQHLGLPTE